MSHYFVIRSELNSKLVLDIKGDKGVPGSQVITWDAKPEGQNTNQLWYEDYGTLTIRSKLNNFCLDIAGDKTVVNPFVPNKLDQQWVLAGKKVFNRSSGKCLDISGGKTSRGGKVIVYPYQGSANQHWNFEYKDELAPEISAGSQEAVRFTKSFYIYSEECGLVLDVMGDSGSRGSPVILYKCKNNDSSNQLWYKDRNGVIRSRLNDYALDATGETLQIQPYHKDNYYQQWTISRDVLFNIRNKHMVIGIVGLRGHNKSKLNVGTYAAFDSQRWRVQYIHDASSTKRKTANQSNSLLEQSLVSQPREDEINGQPVY